MNVSNWVKLTPSDGYVLFNCSDESDPSTWHFASKVACSSTEVDNWSEITEEEAATKQAEQEAYLESLAEAAEEENTEETTEETTEE